jgi:hypothetical protein
MTTIRCSSLDRVMACASSTLPVEHPYTPETDEANEGTAAHEALAAMVRGEEPDLDAIAARYRVDRDALDFLLRRGRLAWTGVGGEIYDAEVFVTATTPGGIEITGHADALAFAAGQVIVVDWKAGWRPRGHPHQTIGYTYCAAEMRKADGATTIETHLRAGERDVRVYSRDDLRAWAARLDEHVSRAGEQWGPSEACTYCPRQLMCDSRDQYLRSTAIAVSGAEGVGGEIDRVKIGSLWERSRSLSAALRRYESAIDEALALGPIDLGDGRQLARVETKRDKIVPSAALPLIGELGIDPDTCLRVSKTALCDAVKADAQKGKGASAVRALLAALEAAEAIEKETHFEKRVIATPKETK